MFEELKKRTLKGTLAWSIILILAGVVLAGWNAVSALQVVTGYVDFSTLEPGKINNQVVKIDLAYNFACYLEEYSKNTKTNATTTTHYYYVILTRDGEELDDRFMSIKVPAKFGAELDDMAMATAEGGTTTPMTFYGKIKKLDSEEMYYFKDYLKEFGWTDEDIEAETRK